MATRIIIVEMGLTFLGCLTLINAVGIRIVSSEYRCVHSLLDRRRLNPLVGVNHLLLNGAAALLLEESSFVTPQFDRMTSC